MGEGVALYLGHSRCLVCLASHGVYRSRIGDGQSAMDLAQWQARQAADRQDHADSEAIESRKAAETTKVAAKLAGTVQKKVDSDRLLKRQRRSISG